MREALLWKKLKEDKVQCGLCNHYCAVAPGERGKCGVRENRDGTLYTLVFNKVAAVNMDPVEKKPLYHFMPGTSTFSIGTEGCNMVCSFCQNWSLSQNVKSGARPRGEEVSPESLVDAALANDAASISYTYSEPTIFFELVHETSKIAKNRGLKNIMVSNGFMTGECIDMMAETIDAANIDLKAFTERFYEELCGVRLGPVLENLKRIKAAGIWLEVTTLVIPGWNDSRSEMEKIASYVADELGTETPWHVSRFHPQHKMTDRSTTPVSTLDMAWDVGAEAGLKFVYVGNVPGNKGNSTYCPKCRQMIIERDGFYTGTRNLTEEGACRACGEPIDLR